MASTKKVLLTLFLFLMCCFCILIDARMPDCVGMQDRCQCHRSYTSLKDETGEHQRRCLKLFSKKESWDRATQTCANESSALVHYRIPDSFIEDFRNKSVRLIWIGIRKRLGFYTVRAPVEYIFKKSNNSEQGLEWENEEPIHECVAFNISSGHLVTQNCHTNLEYVCQNFGFPVYPVSKSLACPTEWLFFYQRQFGMLNCIKVFKSRPGRNAVATCLELRSQVADLRDFREVYEHMNELNITGYGLKGNGSNCDIKRIESVFGDHLKENLTCFDEIFICERNLSRISLKPKVSPDFSDSVESATIQQSFLACEVLFKSRFLSAVEDQLHYTWYKDEIPISVDSPVLNLSSYPEPVKQSSSYAIRQGTYRCVVTVEGIVDHFSSQYVNYFYMGLATYIVYVQADLKSVLNVDFSQDQSFNSLMNLVNNSISAFIENIAWHVQKPNWDYQMSWKNEENVTVQLLFYNYFDDESYRYFDERTLEMDLKRKLLTNLSFNSSISLEVDRADTCFQQAVPSSRTSFNVSFIWRTTTQTKSAVSEPMCLNDWRLITRKCQPSVIWGATWGHVDVSQCTKYQFPLKDLQLFCPEGFRNLGPNLCYNINSGQKTFEEAEEVCKNRSSVLEDFDPLLRIRWRLNPDQFNTWLPNKRDLRDKAKEQWLENNSSINRRNRTLLCATLYKNGTSNMWKCDSNERHPFVCVHHPFSLLKSFIFSKPWYKYSDKRASYYLEYSEKNWHEANKSCYAFPAQSTLLQSIRNLEEYSLFKVLLRQLRQDAGESSWWLNLLQDGDSLKWLSSPEESPTFVDWERHTDFKMDRSAGVLTVTNKSAHWSLRDLSSKQRSICEMQDFKESHPTAVYVEDRTSIQEDESGGAYKVDLKCVPSGWFVHDSIIWLKDGTAIYSQKGDIYASEQRLQFNLTAPFRMENVSEFQGYYYCSVDLDNSYKTIFSPKLLVKFPGLHTFILHVKSEIPERSNCSDLNSLQLPFIAEFNKFLDALYSNGSRLFLKEVACSGSVISTYHHFYILKDKGTEKELLNFLERSISSGNGALFQSLKRLNINKDNFTLKSTVSCPKEMTHYNGHHLTWPETPIGENTLPDEMCITVKGFALERKCLGDFYTGAHWSPVEKDCTDAQTELTMTLHRLAKTNITENNVLNLSLSMEMLTTTSEGLSPADVQFTVQILRNVASIPIIEPEVLRASVHTVDAVIEAISTSEYRDILSNLSSKITSAMENITLNTQTNERAVKVAVNNIAMYVLPLTLVPRGGVLENWGSNVSLLFNDSNKNLDEQLNQFESIEAAALLPENVLTKTLSNNRTTMVMAIRKNSQLLQNVSVIIPVIDLAIGSEPVYDVDPPLEMVFKIPKMSSRERNANWGCASWDQTLNNNFGGWSYKGCFTVLIDSTHVRCCCNHLSSFTVVLEINPGFKIPKVHELVLNIITYIGCSLSVLGLGIVILTFAIFRKWRKDVRHKILFNLSLSLVSFLLVFLIGIQETGWGHGCMVVAVLLHYFMLSSFSWMLVEAFLHYLCLVKVIGTYIPRFLQKTMLFAWGMPVIIVGIVLSVNYNLYYSEIEYCWLSGNVLYFAVAFPVSTLLAINFIMFGVISFSLTCGGSKQTLRTNQDPKKDMEIRAKAMFCVSVLLGLSWVFGILAAVKETKLVFQYLFVITTTLQGFLFFVFFVFCQKSTRELWRNLVKTASTSNSSQATRLKHLTRGLARERPHTFEPWAREEDEV